MPKQPAGVDLAFQYNMFYKALQNRTIQLGPKETVEFIATIPHCSSEAIFLPWRLDQIFAPNP